MGVLLASESQSYRVTDTQGYSVYGSLRSQGDYDLNNRLIRIPDLCICGSAIQVSTIF